MTNSSLKLTDLPLVRGRITENAPLGGVSWFRCGGRADVLFKPADSADLADFLRGIESHIPITVLGVMSNVIVRDGGVRGVVIRLGRDFAEIQEDHAAGQEQDFGARLIRVGAAALDGNVAAFAAREGIAGLEFLSGIPGAIGGALRMNAGAYGTEMKDVLVLAEAVDRAGHVHSLVPCHFDGSRNDTSLEEMSMSYRHTDVPEDYIFTGCVLRGHAGNPEEIKAAIKDIKTRRGDTQPIRERTGGSTFANPLPEELAAAGLPEGTKAWELVDRVGGRGLKIGGAMMSEKHANFMINTGDATATDLEALGDEMRRRVWEETGLELRWEIKRIGEKETL